jgi:hypothetical protein
LPQIGRLPLNMQQAIAVEPPPPCVKAGECGGGGGGGNARTHARTHPQLPGVNAPSASSGRSSTSVRCTGRANSTSCLCTPAPQLPSITCRPLGRSPSWSSGWLSVGT